MRRKLAHLLRRVARVMIRQSNKLDPIVYEAPVLGVNFVEPWSVQYAVHA